MTSETLPQPTDRKRILVVTGMSGAGKSSTLKALEDLGYEAVDNLPMSLLPNLLTLPPPQSEITAPQSLALGIDSRTRAFDPAGLLMLVENMNEQADAEILLIFLDCSDETLVRRFTETRRRHPLAGERPIMDGISRERRLMQPLQDKANLVIDTGTLNVHELKRLLRAQFNLGEDGGLTLTVMSFSYSKGLPREADIVFDVRFLKNPHYENGLKDKTGKDPAVADYIETDTAFVPFLDSLTNLLLSLLPRYKGEGKAYLTIAFGCTGGRHRSVYLAERVATLLTGEGYHPGIVHRDAGFD